MIQKPNDTIKTKISVKVADPILDGGSPNGSRSSACFVPAGSIIASRPRPTPTKPIKTTTSPDVINAKALSFEGRDI